MSHEPSPLCYGHVFSGTAQDYSGKLSCGTSVSYRPLPD